MEIANRQILISGANSGIGRAFAKVCARDKAHLHLVVRKRDEELIADLEASGAKSVVVYESDLAFRHSIEELITELRGQNIDILFNNAGVLTGGLLEEQPLDDIYKMLQVNIGALVQLTQGLLPGMLERKRGKIVNNSSVAAYMNFPCASTYAASKAAVAAFTNSLELELRGTGVSTLLLITPGIKTKMFDRIEEMYGKNIKVPDYTITPAKYADMIREAIVADLKFVEPEGLTWLGMKVAKHMKPLFDFEVTRRFKRNGL